MKTFLDYGVENNDQLFKLKVDICVRISPHQCIFVKGCTPKWAEENFLIKKSQKYCIADICYQWP